MSKYILSFFTLLLTIFTVYGKKHANYIDSLQNAVVDTLSRDSRLQDTLNNSSQTGTIMFSDDALDVPVTYKADDSIAFDVQNRKAYLYGNAEVLYEDISLNAALIELDWSKNLVTAIGVLDSNGKTIGKPVFVDGEDKYKSDKIIYNFESKKGKVYDVITTEGEGYVHGKEIKMMPNKDLYIKNAKYTTCDLEEPHFNLKITKLKVVPEKVIVAGPSFIEIAGIPTPFIIPFGIFPIQKSQASGVIIPEYGESTNQGFYLRNGGYYFGISDNFDLKLIGNIYSRGTWGLSASSNYKVRYKFGGNLSVNYAFNKFTTNDLLGSTEQTNFNISWSHKQDPKANLNSSFDAKVQVATPGFFRNNSYDPASFLANELNSAINYRKSFGKSPFSLNASLRHNQNLQTKKLNLTIPDLALTMSRIYPFKRKEKVGSTRWYEKIGLNYTMVAKNTISTYDSLLFEGKVALKDFNNGMRHSASINLGSYKILKYLNLSVLPAFSYREYWYLSTVEKMYDKTTDAVITNERVGFATARDFSDLTANMKTILYGMYKFKKGKIKAIRHVLTPSVGARYKFDFSDPFWGFYKTYQKDSLGNTATYSPFAGGIVGGPGTGKFGGIDFSLLQNLEMKIRTKKDTVTGEKKIKLVDRFFIRSAYDLLADSLKLSTFTVDGNTKLFNKFNVRLSANYDPYISDTNNTRFNTTELKANGRLLRLTTANLTVSTSFNSKAKNNSTLQQAEDNIHNYDNGLASSVFVDFDIPWNLSLFYNIRADKRFVNKVDTILLTQTLNFNGNFSLTKNWKVTFQSGYDFVNKSITSNTKISVVRDLHCWQMSFDWIPFGRWQSYTFTLRPKASILQDLKLNKRRDWFDR